MGIADKSHFFIEQEFIEIIYCQYYPAIWGVISNTLLVWKKNVNTLPRVAMNWKICPFGNLHPMALEIALGPRGANSGGVFSNTSLLSAAYYYNTSHVGKAFSCKKHSQTKVSLIKCASVCLPEFYSDFIENLKADVPKPT